MKPIQPPGSISSIGDNRPVNAPPALSYEPQPIVIPGAVTIYSLIAGTRATIPPFAGGDIHWVAISDPSNMISASDDTLIVLPAPGIYQVGITLWWIADDQFYLQPTTTFPTVICPVGPAAQNVQPFTGFTDWLSAISWSFLTPPDTPAGFELQISAFAIPWGADSGSAVGAEMAGAGVQILYVGQP